MGKENETKKKDKKESKKKEQNGIKYWKNRKN